MIRNYLKFIYKKLSIIPYIIHYFVYALHENNKYIKKDIDEYVNHVLFGRKLSKYDAMVFLYLISSYKDFRSVFYLRTGDIGRVLSKLFPGRECFYMFNPSATVGAGLVLHHPVATRISCRKIGERCQIWQMVTIGKGKHTEGLGDTPIIGSNVKISVGATIVGGITIGNNVNIGAGAIVTKSVPDDCTIVGNPARIIKRGSVKVNEKL